MSLHTYLYPFGRLVKYSIALVYSIPKLIAYPCCFIERERECTTFCMSKIVAIIYGMGDFNHYQKGAAQNFHFPRTGLCQGDEHINCYEASFFVIQRFGFISSSS